MTFKQKYEYWHRVTWTNPDIKENKKVGDLFGVLERHDGEWYGYDPHSKTFPALFKTKVIGKVLLTVSDEEKLKIVQEWEKKFEKVPV